MGKRLGLDRVLECFSLSMSPNSCVCVHAVEEGEEEYAEKKALLKSHFDQMLKLKDIVDGTKTLAFHLEPKTVVLRVSMHCNGCARKVQKHISKMEGVTSFEVDLENKKVVVMGDITHLKFLRASQR
uniref:HMA domain-containing protein n=1 Tax=Ananas comosus var. bracteatus TaxID=296719 RepID=A0A6V7PT29_ANACO|nr:unnamed protein product [Ananas comosus var. bracteatus]